MAETADILKGLTPLNDRVRPQHVSLSVYVADQLEGLLTSGTIAAGQKLPPETELCSFFGVSRTVIREAVTQLKSLGLVETRRGVGTTVIRTSIVDVMPAKTISLATVENILHVLELRLSIEPAAAELAAQRHDAGDRRILMDRHTAFIRAQFGELTGQDEDYNFHCAIAAATKNPLFEAFYERLGHNMTPRSNLMHDQMDNFVLGSYLARVEQEHSRILEAILGRDATTARDMMYQHLLRATHTYKKYNNGSHNPALASP